MSGAAENGTQFHGVDLGWMQAMWRDCSDKGKQLGIFRDMVGKKVTVKEILDAVGDPSYCGPMCEAKRVHKKYTAEDDQQIAAMAAEGKTNREIAEAMDVSVKAAGSKVLQLRKSGVDIPERPRERKLQEEVPGEEPEDVPEKVPEKVPEVIPEEVPEKIREEAPEEVPGEEPEEIPAAVPGEDPGSCIIPQKKNTGRWTPEEDEYLIRSAGEGMTDKAIGDFLNRGEKAVAVRFVALRKRGVRVPERKRGGDHRQRHTAAPEEAGEASGTEACLSGIRQEVLELRRAEEDLTAALIAVRARKAEIRLALAGFIEMMYTEGGGGDG